MITNSKFYNGLGVAMGSIGQYNGQFETIERITVKNVEYENTLHAVSIYQPESQILIRHHIVQPCS